MIPPLEHIIYNLHLGNSFLVASKALLVYDFLLVFDEEISLIWLSSWTPVKVVYLISRYMPFVDMVIAIYHQFAPNLTLAQCKTAHGVNGLMYVFGMGLNEGILTLRIWLLWEKNKKMAFGLPIFFCIAWGTDFALARRFATTLSFFDLPYPFNKGCALLSGDHTVVVDWISLLLYNTVTLALVLIRAIYFAKLGISSHLLNRLYKNCIYYYLFLFLVSAVNVSVILADDDYLTMLASTIRTLHSIVSNRVILDIRREVATPRGQSGPELSSLGDWN